MDKKLGVLVGTGIGGQRNILNAVQNEGFDAKSVGIRQWPRDHFVHFNNSYIKRASGSNGENIFGEGGYIRTGQGYLLLGSGIGDLVTNYSAKDFLGLNGSDKKDESDLALITKAKQYFPKTRMHIVPTGLFNGKGHNHLDMSVLLAPDSNLLVVDSHYGELASNGDEIEKIGEIEGLKVIRYNGSQDGVWYPLNALILPVDGANTAIVDNRASSLITLLENNGVKAVGVDIPQYEYPAGKINCQTNTYALGNDPEDLLEKF